MNNKRGKKRVKRIVAMMLTIAMVIAPFEGFEFVGEVLEKTNVISKARAAVDIVDTGIETYPYFNNEPAKADSSKALGSEAYPLEIASADQLYNLQYVCNNSEINPNYMIAGEDESGVQEMQPVKYSKCYYKIVADIDLSQISGGIDWTPIGKDIAQFYGVFDGGNVSGIEGEEGFSISNMKLENPSSISNLGLFGAIGLGATVKNVTLKDSTISGTTPSIASRCGLIVGSAYGYGAGDEIATVDNCHVVEGTINVTSTAYAPSETGITSISDGNGGRLDDSIFSYGFGGVVGFGGGNVIISNCSNESGSIQCDGIKQVGGVIGTIEGGSLIYCNNTAIVKGNVNVGGVCGFIGASVAVQYCQNTAAVSGLEWSYDMWSMLSSGSQSKYQSEAGIYHSLAPATGIGGVAGKSASAILYSENTGNISGYELCGGIVGGTLKGAGFCMNSGSVSYAGNEEYTYSNQVINGDESIPEFQYSVYDSESDMFNEYSATLIPHGISIGGIAGSFGFFEYSDGIEEVSVNFCGNTGNVKGFDYVAGMVGNRNYSDEIAEGNPNPMTPVTPVYNSYNTGTITVSPSNDVVASADAIARNFISDSQPYTDSYYLVEAASTDEPYGLTEQQFASGEAAWLMSQFEGENTHVWMQILGEETRPHALVPPMGSETDMAQYIYRVQYMPLDETDTEDYTSLTQYVQYKGNIVPPEMTSDAYTYEFYQVTEGEDGSITATDIPLEDMVVTSDCVVGVKKTIMATASPTPTSTPASTPTSTPTVTSDATPTQTPFSDGGQIPVTPTSPAPTGVTVGAKVTQGGTSYTVTGNASATVNGVANQTASVITIPSSITVNGKTLKVTAIVKSAFERNNKVKKVIMGQNIATIGAKAFKGCSKLKTVSYSNKVVTVGDESFANCKKLTSVTLPDTTRKIGKKAFYNCKGLKNIKFGKKRSDKKKGSIESGDMADFVNAIASETFTQRDTVDTYSALNMKISIGNSALENCTNLKSVIVNCAVSVIGNSAFKNCQKLSSIIVRSLILKTVGKKALTGVSKCKISVPTQKFSPYRKLFKNKGQGKKVLVAKA